MSLAPGPISRISAGLLALALACATPPPGPRPASARFEPMRFEETYDRARAVLEQRGYALAEANSLKGRLATEPRPLDGRCGGAACRMQERVEVDLSIQGEMTVRVRREVLREGAWVPATSPDQIADAESIETYLVAAMAGSR